MKTKSYKALRAFCMLFIIGIVILNLVLIVYLCYHRKVLSLETGILLGHRITIRSSAVGLIYLNLLLSFLNGYAFNIASKFMLTATMWLTILVNLFSAFIIIYLKCFGENMLKAAFGTNIFNPDGSIIYGLEETFKSDNLVNSRELFFKTYKEVLENFITCEMLIIVCLTVLVIGAITRQFMKVHLPEENYEDAPVILDTTLVVPESLRGRPIAVGL